MTPKTTKSDGNPANRVRIEPQTQAPALWLCLPLGVRCCLGKWEPARMGTHLNGRHYRPLRDRLPAVDADPKPPE
jgi:hypothetical protein